MKAICVIPVRGGSKGIPRKNLLPIAGKPLVVWTIEQALAVPDLRVIVSTEDAEIAEVSRRAGAEVVDRPPNLAQDTTASEPVVEHVISVLTERGERPDVVMFLQATSPVRLRGTLARALIEFEATRADALVGVIAETPFLWNLDHPATADYDYTRRPRRQEIPPEAMKYRENGSVYVTRTEIYETLHNRLGGHIELFVMDAIEATDIDTPVDFALAEQALARLG